MGFCKTRCGRRNTARALGAECTMGQISGGPALTKHPSGCFSNNVETPLASLFFANIVSISRLQIWHLAYKTGVSLSNMQFSIYKQASRLTNWRLRLHLSLKMRAFRPRDCPRDCGWGARYFFVKNCDRF